jgi:phospholipase/carboxylesterase
MSEPLLPAVEIDPPGPTAASVIWLHGLGADGHDFEPIVPELGLPREAAVRFVFPHAPMRPVTINGGFVMRAWYDIKTMDLGRHVDAEDLEGSSRQLEAWVAHERSAGIPSERIVVAGFSQGGAIALYTGLQHEERLGGILALSCYHPLPELIRERGSNANRGVPIFMGHGTDDPVVPVALAETTVAALRENGYDPEWRTYPMPHSVSAEEIRDVGRWLQARIDAESR